MGEGLLLSEPKAVTAPLVSVADMVLAFSLEGGLTIVVPSSDMPELPVAKTWNVIVAKMPLPLTPALDRSMSATPWMYPWLLDIGDMSGLHVKIVVPAFARKVPSVKEVRFRT